MKVLQINSSVNTTSTGRITEEIGQTLQKHGHESFIAYKKAGPAGSTSNLIQIGSDLEYYLHGLKTRLLDRHGFGSERATHKLVEEIKSLNPDVIGIHNLHGYYLNIEVLFSYLKEIQKPVVWTFHDCWPFTGHCSFYDFASCEKWKSECHECPLTDKYPASWLLDNSRHNFQQKKELFNGVQNLTIITPSNWLKNQVSQSFLSNYPVSVINNGIDLERFRPQEAEGLKAKYNISGKKLLLGVASVWDRRKGLSYFLELGSKLDDSFRIVLIGLTEDKIKELPENIIGIPRTEDINELVTFYSAADIFVNPTLVDNFPTTNLEALACGTPVITFDTGGSPEAVDEQTGMVVEKGKTIQLLEAINKILNNNSKDYQAKCRDRAQRWYNKEERFNDYIRTYERMVD